MKTTPLFKNMSLMFIFVFGICFDDFLFLNICSISKTIENRLAIFLRQFFECRHSTPKMKVFCVFKFIWLVIFSEPNRCYHLLRRRLCCVEMKRKFGWNLKLLFSLIIIITDLFSSFFFEHVSSIVVSFLFNFL